jgi:hypothetical protein
VADSGPPEQKTDPISNRWWVDSSTASKAKARPAAEGIAGSRFFRAGLGFEQEPARERLTDNNLKILKQAMPVEGAWSYIQLADTSFPQRERERIEREAPLPPYARGVLVDCGRSVRLLVTGTPIGERLLEMTLSEAPSFDCWVYDEWVREQVFKDAGAALRALRRFMEDYLSPEAIKLSQEIAARA